MSGPARVSAARVAMLARRAAVLAGARSLQRSRRRHSRDTQPNGATALCGQPRRIAVAARLAAGRPQVRPGCCNAGRVVADPTAQARVFREAATVRRPRPAANPAVPVPAGAGGAGVGAGFGVGCGGRWRGSNRGSRAVGGGATTVASYRMGSRAGDGCRGGNSGSSGTSMIEASSARPAGLSGRTEVTRSLSTQSTGPFSPFRGQSL